MKHLGKAEQAVYERLRFGAMSDGEASLFTRQISALVAARIARRLPGGGVELVNGAQLHPPAHHTQPPPAPSQSGAHELGAVTMPTVTARVPQDVIDYADGIREPGESRGGALRRLLSAAVARGLCRPARKAGAGGGS